MEFHEFVYFRQDVLLCFTIFPFTRKTNASGQAPVVLSHNWTFARGWWIKQISHAWHSKAATHHSTSHGWRINKVHFSSFVVEPWRLDGHTCWQGNIPLVIWSCQRFVPKQPGHLKASLNPTAMQIMGTLLHWNKFSMDALVANKAQSRTCVCQMEKLVFFGQGILKKLTRFVLFKWLVWSARFKSLKTWVLPIHALFLNPRNLT